MILLDFTLLAILFVVAYQDFKYRAISIWILPLLFANFIFIGLNKYLTSELIINSIINIIIFALQLLIVSIYFSIKYKKLYNIVNNQIGIGDIFFILVLCFAIPPIKFILFQTFSYLIILVLYLTIRTLFTVSDKQIPLAGGLSISLALFWLLNLAFKDLLINLV